MTDPQVTKQEPLIAEIKRIFSSGPFDATSIAWKMEAYPSLAAAVEAAIPNCRLKSGRFRIPAVRRTLAKLAKKHFVTDRYGWWYIKEDQSNAKSCGNSQI